MSGQEPPYYLPPLYQSPDAGSIWDPNGPDGQLVDASDPAGRTIGEIAQMEGAPPYGWIRGPEGLAMPEPLVNAGTPPHGAIAAMQQQAKSPVPDDVTQRHLLLLFED